MIEIFSTGPVVNNLNVSSSNTTSQFLEDENLEHIFDVEVPTLLDSLPEILTREVTSREEEERSSDGVSRKLNVNTIINDPELDLSYDQMEDFSISDTDQDIDEYFDVGFENSLIEKTTIVNISEENYENKETQILITNKTRIYKDSSEFRQRFTPPRGLQVQEGRRSRRA